MTTEKRSNQVETIKQRVALLFDELILAAGWQRPSILFAMYRSRLVRIEAQAALEKKLNRLNQSVYYLRVNEENFDIPLFLIQFPEREKTVFFIEELFSSGGKLGVNAFRTLNIRRELLVDYSIRSVFWLTPDEAGYLPVNAPDFWAFRHRMIEFLDQPAARRVSALVDALTPAYWDVNALARDAGSKIVLREELLNLIPDDWKNAPVLRVELLNLLAGLYWAQADYTRSLNVIQPALETAQQLENKTLQSRCWLSLGLVLQSMQRPGEALQAFQTATQLDASREYAWMGQGDVHQQQGRLEAAVLAYRQSIAINPKNATAWNHLGAVFLAFGQAEEALRAYQHATRANPSGAQPWEKLAQIYRSQGRYQQALPALKMIASLRGDELDANGWVDLGLGYRAAGKISSAIRAFYKATRRAPGQALPWKVLGEIYFSQGQLRYARKAYKTACLLDPQDETLQSALKACYPDRNKQI